MKKLKTISLKGKEYVQVNERVSFLNEEYKNCRIDSQPTFNGDTVYFKATITPDVKNPDRYFVGHSFGSLKGEKALEKLETVAVGRALAFMGIGIVESIASADEMAKFNNKEIKNSFVIPGKCNVCGATAVQSARGNWYCPNYKSHGPFKIEAEPQKMDKNMQEFVDSLPQYDTYGLEGIDAAK